MAWKRKRIIKYRFIKLVIEIWNLYGIIEIIELRWMWIEIVERVEVWILNIGKFKISISKRKWWWNRRIKE